MLELLPGILIFIVFFIAIGVMIAKSGQDKDSRKVDIEIIDNALKDDDEIASAKQPKPSLINDLADGSVEHTIYTCYLEGKCAAEILRDSRLAEWKSKGKIYDKVIYIEYVGIQMIKEGVIDSTKKKLKIDHTLKAIGNVDPICPCCNIRLDKKPTNKKKCPNCGSIIYVRIRPHDREKVLVSETQAKQIKRQWNQYRNR
jgi:predicted RNA-binding Zn-ribbon protein involved in translation (DUF1610 family)